VSFAEIIDISRWQGDDVDPQAVFDGGQQAIIIRSSYGRTGRDPQFHSNWARARDVPGLIVGAYHYGTADDGLDADLEAENMLRGLAEAGFLPDADLPPALDFEWKSTDVNWSGEQHADWIGRFIERVELELGQSPMIYTGRNTWKNRVGYTDRFAHLPLWQADYDGELADMPWPFVTIHQYGVGDRGSVPGVAGRVDRNRVFGGRATLEALVAGGLWTPENPWRLPTEPSAVAQGVLCSWPTLDLRLVDSKIRDEAVASAQGLALARGLPSDGLVGKDGRPDGKAGPKTMAMVSAARASAGLPGLPILDAAVWGQLSQHTRS